MSEPASAPAAVTTPQPNLPSSANATRGYVLAAVSAVLWGFSGVVTKFMLRDRQMRPDELLIFRTGFASLILFAWLARSSPRLLKVDRRDIPYLALFAAFGMVVCQGAYYFALSFASVGYVLLVQYQAPVLMMIYGVWTKTERMTAGKLAAAALAVGGCALMILGGQPGSARASVPGTLFALLSALGFTFYAIYGRRGLAKYDPRTMLAYAFLFAALMWMVIRPLWTLPWASYTLSTYALFFYLAVVATVIPFALFLTSLKYLEPSRSSLTSMLEPVVAAIAAWVWLDERMWPLQLAGGAAVLGGVLLLQLESALGLRRASARAASSAARRD